MNNRKWISVLLALLLMVGGGGLLVWMKAHQKLGRPGVAIEPIPGNTNVDVVNVVLPASVLDYSSQVLTQQEIVVAVLPKDTSFGGRMYRAPDDFWIQLNVVLMGSDRTSLHKPQFCLEGAGWRIDSSASKEEQVPVARPQAYNLPVMKLLTTKEFENNGERRTYRGIFVYWFVADDAFTAQHNQRMWWMARDLLRTGVLQRWAYVTCFAVCAPGEEDATIERMKKFLSAAVPEFQLTPRPFTDTAARP